MSKKAWTVIFTANARKDVRQLQKQIAIRIYSKLKFLTQAEDPSRTATKMIKSADAQYRWRVGNYRILFDVDTDKNLIITLKIQHRRQVYR